MSNNQGINVVELMKETARQEIKDHLKGFMDALDADLAENFNNLIANQNDLLSKIEAIQTRLDKLDGGTLPTEPKGEEGKEL